MAVCPGGKVGVDWRGDRTIEVRDPATLAVTAERTLAADGVEQVLCLDPSGTDIVAVQTLDAASADPTRALIDSEGAELARGPSLWATGVGDGVVVVTAADATPRSTVVSLIDRRGRTKREIARSDVEPGSEYAGFFDNFVADRSQSLLAFRATNANGASTSVVVVDLATGLEHARREIPNEAWLLGWGDSGLAVKYPDRIELWDDALTMAASVPSQAPISSAIERDGVLYAFDGPRLLSIDVATGESTVLNVLPSGYPSAVVLDWPAVTVASSALPAATLSADASTPAAPATSGTGVRRLWVVPGLVVLAGGSVFATVLFGSRRAGRHP